MAFYFDSLHDFIHMDGHGLFVWLCYLMTVTVFGGLFVLSWMKKSAFIRKQTQMLRRE